MLKFVSLWFQNHHHRSILKGGGGRQRFPYNQRRTSPEVGGRGGKKAAAVSLSFSMGLNNIKQSGHSPYEGGTPQMHSGLIRVVCF